MLVHCVHLGACICWKSRSDPLDMEFQTALSHHVDSDCIRGQSCEGKAKSKMEVTDGGFREEEDSRI